MISSIHNPKIKMLRDLYTRKGRNKYGLIVTEGIILVSDALDAGAEPFSVFIGPRVWSTEEGQNLVNRLKGKNITLIEISEDLMIKVSNTKTPQGVIGLFKEPGYFMEDIIKTGSFFLVLDKVSDPGNVGTLIRAGTGVSICGIFLTSGSADPYNHKVVRASMGSVFRTPVIRVDDEKHLVSNLKEKGVRIITAEAKRESIRYDSINYQKPCAVVIGNETKGVSPFFSDRKDLAIHIPTSSELESLNAAMAGTVILFEMWRQNGFGVL